MVLPRVVGYKIHYAKTVRTAPDPGYLSVCTLAGSHQSLRSRPEHRVRHGFSQSEPLEPTE